MSFKCSHGSNVGVKRISPQGSRHVLGSGATTEEGLRREKRNALWQPERGPGRL